ncbi:MAG TPA: cyclic nucleotide-binding domain-containing protein [Actinomycetota bacterium]|nr:cyclic nucleotide-binding domain-containing protein [Actinomycetota bacterium]
MTGVDLADTFAGFALFADLPRHRLEALAHTFEEEWFAAGQRVVRQGFGGAGFYVILEGEAVVSVDGRERARLGRGDFFGELSVLLEEPPAADVTAASALRCATLAGPHLQDVLLDYPSISLRMLQAELRRLRASNQWQA